MRRTLLCAFLALVCGLSVSPPALSILTGRGIGMCAGDQTATTDGCLTAATNGAFQQSNFDAIAAQNGQQSQLGTEVRGWWRAFVEFADGYSLGTLTGAATVGLPSGCTMAAATGSTPRKITCEGVNNLTLHAVDYADGHSDCTEVLIDNATGVITLDQFDIEVRGLCVGALYIVQITNSPNVTSLVITHGVVNGKPVDCTNCYTSPVTAIIGDGITGPHTIDVEHVAKLNLSGRFLNCTGSPGNLTQRYVYLDGLNMGEAVSGIHGEDSTCTQASNSAGVTEVTDYSVSRIPNTTPANSSDTIWYLSGGSVPSNVTYSFVSVKHSYCVTNATPGGTATIAAACWQIAYSNYTQADFEYDFIDPNGALFCAEAVSSPTGAGVTSPTFNQVFDLYDLSPITTYNTVCPGRASS